METQRPGRKSGSEHAALHHAACVLIACASAGVLALGCDSKSESHDASTSKSPATGEGHDAAAHDAAAHDAATATPGTTHIDRSALTDVGSDKPLDYGDPRMWLCRPGNDPDECDANLDATELLPDGTRKVDKHVKAEKPSFDCFYVYPTVKLTSAGPMTDFANIDITLDPLLAQAARFNEVCRVYAPLYRQNGVVPGAGGMPTAGGSFDVGLQDVRDAFKYYLEHLNDGRKFVLLGHSQGTGMLTGMMKQDVDPVDDVRAKLISALLIGGGVAVPEGADVGGTFMNIPICAKPRQVGCVVTYVSYSKEKPPSATSTFGKTTTMGQTNACTEPGALADRAGQPYKGSYIPIDSVNATFVADGFAMLPTDVDTNWIVYRDVFHGECKSANGASYLEISNLMTADDKRPPFPYHYAAIEGALGLHLLDYALEMDDLIETVRLQAEAAK